VLAYMCIMLHGLLGLEFTAVLCKLWGRWMGSAAGGTIIVRSHISWLY
jgi:hypothetical protein